MPHRLRALELLTGTRFERTLPRLTVVTGTNNFYELISTTDVHRVLCAPAAVAFIPELVPTGVGGLSYPRPLPPCLR